MVFLYILSFQGSFVGLSLGVLLPSVFPGACLGGILALVVNAMVGITNSYYFPVSAGVLAVVLSFLSARYVIQLPLYCRLTFQ